MITNGRRAAGITRHENAVSAVQKCPDIRLVHVQTWKEGDVESRYHEDPTVVDHKVSLDPYRRASRQILEIFKKHCDRVEKASIDESFLDLSSVVKAKLMETYGHLLDPDVAKLEDPLPEAPNVDWSPVSGILIDLDKDHTEEDRNDWDDVIMYIAADFMQKIRQDVKDTLGYTCSAGIARNKTLAKLAAGQNKPAKQTILRNRAVQSFLNGLPFTKIRNLGGKLGIEVEKIFETSSAKDITAISIEDLRKKLGTETGQWLYNIVRGIDYSEVSVSTQVKSMLSAKSFRPQIDSIAQAERWIKVLTADLASRVLEDPNQRRPKTLTMHHRVPGSSKNRQCPIPRGPELNNEFLAGLAMKLLNQINTEGRAFPCFNLSLGLSGFEGLELGIQDIGGFFKQPVRREDSDSHEPDAIVTKELTEDAVIRGEKRPAEEEAERLFAKEKGFTVQREETNGSNASGNDGSFLCDRCHKPILGQTAEEHLDWHFAKDLSKELSMSDQATRTSGNNNNPGPARGTIGSKVKLRPSKARGAPEKGQKKLKF